MANDEVKVKISIDGASAKKQLKDIKKEAIDTGREIESQSRQISNSAFFTGTAIAMGLAVAGKGIAKLTGSYDNLTEKVEKYSKFKFFSGLDDDKIEKLDKVLKIGGSSIESFGSAFQSMSKFISGKEFGEIDTNMIKAFEKLGIFDSTQYTEPFELLIDAIKKLNEETDTGRRNQIADMLHIPIDVLQGYERGSKYIDDIKINSSETKEEIKGLNEEIRLLQENVDATWEKLSTKTILPLKKAIITAEGAIFESINGIIEQKSGERKDVGRRSFLEDLKEENKREKIEKATPSQRLALLTQLGEDFDIDYLLTGKKNIKNNVEEGLKPKQLNVKKLLEDRLRKEGFSEEGIIGVLANVKAESGFNTTIENPTSGALGLFQWLGKRKRDLLALPNWQDPLVQLEFALKEMKTSEGGNVYDKMKHATDKGEATALFETGFERAKGQGIDKRLYYAGIDDEQKSKIFQTFYPEFLKGQRSVIQNNYITVKDVDEAKDFTNQNLEKESKYVQVSVN